jgi:hypothetical protein
MSWPGLLVELTAAMCLCDLLDGLTSEFARHPGRKCIARPTFGWPQLVLELDVKVGDLTPDQVKKLLTSTANPMTGVDAIAQGAGMVLAVVKDQPSMVPRSETGPAHQPGRSAADRCVGHSAGPVAHVAT